MIPGVGGSMPFINMYSCCCGGSEYFAYEESEDSVDTFLEYCNEPLQHLVLEEAERRGVDVQSLVESVP